MAIWAGDCLSRLGSLATIEITLIFQVLIKSFFRVFCLFHGFLF